ncbi:AsmA family protein [Bombella sp. TMW 2.2543]|uniref:AsmA family protein n=1 Tax=Bombella pluederhausensis TaxID=2967336 RepID=A0ABT3WDR6_9PROT|nr:AsmA family protein [Bombella pluederhausensis]MCX5617227.1 AsmA family protein [Bombella pluederhausensis]
MKKLAVILIGLVVVLTGISLAPQFLIDQDHLRQRIMVAFQRQTGLELKMGETSFQLLPWPSFQATNVVLTRPGCTPFVAARSVHADMSLLAVLNREISFQEFTVKGAGIMLHRASEKQCSTWLPVFSQEDTATSPAADGTVSPRWKVSFGGLHLTDAELSWQDDLSDGHVPAGGHLHIKSLELAGMRSASPWVDLQGTHEHTPFTLRGRVGPLSQLFSARAEQKDPWAFSLGMTLGAGDHQDRVTLDGLMRDAHRLKGVNFTLSGRWASLRGMRHLFPHAVPADLGQIEGTVRFHSDDATLPAASSNGADMALTDSLLHLPGRLVPDQIHAHLGSVDLPAGAWHVAAPLQLSDIQIDADSAQAPLVLQGQAAWGRYAWLFHGELASLQQARMAAFGRDPSSVGLNLDVQGQDRTLNSLFNRNDAGKNDVAQEHVSFALQGNVGRQSSTLTFSGQASLLQLPDMKGISGLLVHDGHVKGQLVMNAPGTDGPVSVTVQDMAFDSREFGGTLTADFPAPLGSGMSGKLHLTHMDGDHFTYAPVMELAAEGAHPEEKQASPASNGQKEDRSATDRYMGSQYAGAHGAATDEHMAPSVPDASVQKSLPVQWFGAVATSAFDVDVTADQLHVAGVAYQGLHLHLLGLEGRLSLSVLGGNVQDVPLSGEVVLDGSSDPVRMGMKASPLILPAGWVQMALNQPVTFEGPVQLNGALGTEGAQQDALWQALDGQMGLSLVDGRVHREVLAPLAGPAASLLKMGSGTMGLRCFAGTVKFDHGQAHFNDMALEVKHFSVIGQGTMKLDDMSYTLQLMPHVSLVGADFSTPLVLSGQNGAFHVGTQDKDQPALDTASFGSDACAYAVQQARGGQKGLALPARDEGHSGGAGGILRALGLGGN